MAETRERLQDESGQAMTEYLLLLLVILSMAALVREAFRRYQLADQLLTPFNRRFAYVYRYGHVDARGPDDGGFKKHPRALGDGEENFRLFLNPGRP